MTYNKIHFTGLLISEIYPDKEMMNISASHLRMVYNAGFDDFYMYLIYHPTGNKIILEGTVGEDNYKTSKYKIRIYQFEDEWFLIRVDIPYNLSYVYYKCDQIDGVIDCLKHLENRDKDTKVTPR